MFGSQINSLASLLTPGKGNISGTTALIDKIDSEFHVYSVLQIKILRQNKLIWLNLCLFSFQHPDKVTGEKVREMWKSTEMGERLKNNTLFTILFGKSKISRGKNIVIKYLRFGTLPGTAKSSTVKVCYSEHVTGSLRSQNCQIMALNGLR